MGFIRFILGSPILLFCFICQVIFYFLCFITALLKATLWLIKPIIGNINWSIPTWYPKAQTFLQNSKTYLLNKRVLFGSTIICVGVIGLIANYAYHWQLNRPKPIDPAPIIEKYYDANYYAPNYSNSALTIRFNEKTGYSSPAPLENLNAEIMHGVKLSPEIDGVWKWAQNQKNIYFQPAHNWPLGKQYTVTLDESQLFAKHHHLANNTKPYTFTTQDFSYSIIGEEFYQDPTDPENKMGIFTIRFSHPVNREIFKKKIHLELYENSNDSEKPKFIKNYDYVVTYPENNNDNYTAYINSSALKLPNITGFLKLIIDKGVVAENGGTPSKYLEQSTIKIPGLFSLHLNSVNISLAEKSNQQMQQVLHLAFSHDVRAIDVEKQLKVWQLPKRKAPYIERYYDKLDNTYKTKYTVTAEDLAKAKLITLKAIDTEREYQNQMSFEFKAEQDQQLYLELYQPLTSYGGYHLSNTFNSIVTVPHYPTIMDFAAKGSLLSLSGDKKLSIVSRNMAGLKLNIERVLPSQLQHLAAFNQNNYENMDFGDLNSEHFVEKFTVEKSIEGASEAIKYTDIDLTQYLKESVSDDEIRGVFMVKLYGKRDDKNSNEEENKHYNYYGSRFILVTDIGIINKKSLDQSQDVFVQSIATGKPIANAKVSVLGTNGVEIVSDYSDENGHVKFEPFSDYYQGIKPLLFVVENNHDLSFLPIRNGYDRQLNFSRFEVGGIYESVDGGELRTHLFSDRGIYRPGDTFHIGMITRAQDWSKSLNGIRLEVDITDPKSNRVKTETIMLDEYGFNEIAYNTQYSSPTGEWYINLYLKNPNENYRTLLGSTSVTVREFEPDKTKVSLKLRSKNEPETTNSKDGWLHPDDLIAEINAQNLFGTPAQNRDVQGTLILEPSFPHFKKYENYAFYQYIRGYQNSFNIPIESSSTDENGVATLNLPIQSFEGNYTARVLAEVFEPDSGRSVAATESIFISANPYLVGAKADGRLDYIKKEATRNLEFIAINPKLDQITLTDLVFEVAEQKYLSVLVKQPSGVYKYESRYKEIPISSTPFTIQDSAVNYAINTETPGNYIIRIKDQNDTVVYQTAYSIAGSANVTRSLDRNAELVLKLNNNQYKPGDEIEVSINAPYVGAGLITIERDKVYAWKWFKTDTTSSVQKITLPEGIEGNAYINVQFVRDLASEEIFMSPLSYGVAPFKISNDKFNDKIHLTAPEKIKPGETLPITIETNSKQRVVIFAIDEGILQVSGYKLKNPLDEFLRKRALSVRTAQILDLILPEYNRLLNASAPGGDDYAPQNDALQANLNPFNRKVDEPVAYWSGIIDVDSSKTVEYTVPDYFNGKIRIMAISVGQQTMGSTQMASTVRNDFVLSPNIPYFVAPNDEFEISLSVANNLEDLDQHIVPIHVALTTTPHLTILDEAEKTIELGAMKEGTLKFKLKATDQLGSGDLHFTATYHDKMAQRQISTSVRPISQYRQQTIMGRMDGSKQTVNDFRQMYEPYSTRNAAVSYSPFILSNGLASYLQDYPHLCSEQIVSQAVPKLLNSKYPEFNLISDNGNVSFNQLFQQLQSRQNSDGAIGLWYSTYYVDPFVTLYAVNFMLEAQDAGYTVPATMLRSANNYIRQIASSTRTDNYGLRVRAYAIYLLTRQNEITTNYIASIVSDLNKLKNKWWQSDLTALYLASSYQMLQMDREADNMLKPVWKSLSTAYNNAWWNVNYYDPLVIDSGKIYLISKHFADKANDIPAQALENLVIMLNKGKYTTQSSAMTILALDSYVASINTSALSANDLTISSTTVDQNKQEKLTLIADLNGLLAKGSFADNISALSFANQSQLPAWYSVLQKGFDKNIQEQPITRGLEVYREFTDADNKPINSVELGDTVNVTIRIRTLSNEGATNIAIVDLLPGGFEVVQQPINQYDYENEAEWYSPIAYGEYSWYPDYTDVREDRVIIYGSTSNNHIQTFKYQIKATNVGEYSVPSAYGEAMYDRDIQAVSKGGDKFTVVPRK